MSFHPNYNEMGSDQASFFFFSFLFQDHLTTWLYLKWFVLPVLVFLILYLRGTGDILWQGIRELGPDLFPHTHRAAEQMLNRVQKASAEAIDQVSCKLIEPIKF